MVSTYAPSNQSTDRCRSGTTRRSLGRKHFAVLPAPNRGSFPQFWPASFTILRTLVGSTTMPACRTGLSWASRRTGNKLLPLSVTGSVPGPSRGKTVRGWERNFGSWVCPSQGRLTRVICVASCGVKTSRTDGSSSGKGLLFYSPMSLVYASEPPVIIFPYELERAPWTSR